MAELSFPTKPSTNIDWEDPKAAAEYQQKMAAYNMAISVIQHTLNQEEVAASNREKSNHEACMAIINNMKA